MMCSMILEMTKVKETRLGRPMQGLSLRVIWAKYSP